MKFSIKDITLLPILAGLLMASQVLTYAIPNVNLITFLLIIYTLNLGFVRGLITAWLFTLLMMFVYSFETYIFGYIWIYGLLIVVITLLKHIFRDNEYYWAILAGLFGLSFGFLFALNEYVFLGLNIVVYWINGLVFDIIHMTGNFIITLLLFKPAMKVFRNLLGGQKYENIHEKR